MQSPRITAVPNNNLIKIIDYFFDANEDHTQHSGRKECSGIVRSMARTFISFVSKMAGLTVSAKFSNIGLPYKRKDVLPVVAERFLYLRYLAH